MKLSKRVLALVLSFALPLSLMGCQTPQADPTEPATEATEAEDPALTAYIHAREAVDTAEQLSLRITATKTTSVGGETFTEESSQTLLCSGLGTDTVLYASQEDVSYEDVYSVSYAEVYADGTLYVTVDDTYLFSGAVTAEECAQRYVPAVLLDAALYGEITTDGSVLIFSAPTAAESWAVPEGAELIDASGTAALSPAGELQRTVYTAIYSYGSAEITLTVECYVTVESVTVEVPADTEDYIQLEHVDAARLSEMTIGYLYEAEAVSLSSMKSILSQAAAVVQNHSTIVNTYGSGSGLQAKVENDIYFMDYSTNQDQRYSQVELFRDGVYTITADDGDPETQSGINADLVQSYCDNERGAYMVAFDYWQDAKATDLGSLYLLELTFNEKFGDDIQSNICTNLFGDADLLNSIATSYETNEVTGYIAIDKFTGLPTATGYYYEGTHIIEGYACMLSLQIDQSIEAPSLGSYYTITDEMLPETAPDVLPTPLFYHVTGENGQEMWLFGTIHVGDERTAHLPQEIYDALASSDALALEFYSKAFDEQVEADEELQSAVSDAYYYSDGTTADHIREELYEQAIPYLKATGSYNMNSEYMKASMWANMIDNFYLRQGYDLTNDQGVESRLETYAEDNGIEIRDVESGLFQVRMLTGWSDELQELLLEESLSTDAESSWASTMELYEKWCAGNETELREMLSDEVDTSEFTEEELAEYEEQLPYIEEYNKAMSYDRNDGMLEVAIEYLESGDTVFYAVGLAHLLNNVNGLVDTLREAGYTVELVKYSK